MFALSMGEMLAQMRDYVNAKIAAATARLFLFTYYTNNSADGTEDQVVCDNQEESAGSYLARRMQHFGFRSRPPKGVAAIRLGNYEAASNSVIVAEDSSRYGPGDLEDGEVAIYNKTTGTEIILDADGNIRINVGSGSDVIVNGGTQKVARVDDTVNCGTLTGICPAGTVTFTYTSAGGTPSAPGTTATMNGGEITSGADNFKA